MIYTVFWTGMDESYNEVEFEGTLEKLREYTTYLEEHGAKYITVYDQNDKEIVMDDINNYELCLENARVLIKILDEIVEVEGIDDLGQIAIGAEYTAKLLTAANILKQSLQHTGDI